MRRGALLIGLCGHLTDLALALTILGEKSVPSGHTHSHHTSHETHSSGVPENSSASSETPSALTILDLEKSVPSGHTHSHHTSHETHSSGVPENSSASSETPSASPKKKLSWWELKRLATRKADHLKAAADHLKAATTSKSRSDGKNDQEAEHQRQLKTEEGEKRLGEEQREKAQTVKDIVAKVLRKESEKTHSSEGKHTKTNVSQGTHTKANVSDKDHAASSQSTDHEERQSEFQAAVNDQLALWAGKDFPAEKFSLDSLRLPSELLELHSRRNVHIFGLQNTGTSLLRTLVYYNFGNRLTYFDDLDYRDEEGGAHHAQGLWHHANLKEVWSKDPAIPKAMQALDVSALVTIRNPYSWLHMMRNGSHLLAPCADGPDWLTKECVHSNPGGVHSTVPAAKYSSLEGVWNQWYDGYDRAAEFGFSKVLVISYESLVKEPLHVMQEIANFLQVPKPTRDWHVPFAKVLAAGTNDTAQALITGKLSAQSYMDSLSTLEQIQACSHFDKELQKKYGYDPFECSSIAPGVEPKHLDANVVDGDAKVVAKSGADDVHDFMAKVVAKRDANVSAKLPHAEGADGHAKVAAKPHTEEVHSDAKLAAKSPQASVADGHAKVAAKSGAEQVHGDSKVPAAKWSAKSK